MIQGAAEETGASIFLPWTLLRRGGAKKSRDRETGRGGGRIKSAVCHATQLWCSKQAREEPRNECPPQYRRLPRSALAGSLADTRLCKIRASHDLCLLIIMIHMGNFLFFFFCLRSALLEGLRLQRLLGPNEPEFVFGLGWFGGENERLAAEARITLTVPRGIRCNAPNSRSARVSF